MGHTDKNGLTLSQAAQLVGRSSQWVLMLAKSGFISRHGRGLYPFVPFVRGVIAYYQDRIAKDGERADAVRATDARTREIEVRIAQRRAELISIEDVKAVLHEHARIVRAEFEGFEERIETTPLERARLREEVQAIIQQAEAAAANGETALRTGEIPYFKRASQ